MDWAKLREPDGFSAETALILAHASADAYLNADSKDELERKWGCSASFYSFGDTQFLVLAGDSTIIAYRGTEPRSIADWITDFSAYKSKWETGGHVHAGFMDAYDMARETTREILRASSGSNVYLCGHSLGGGIASLASLDAAEQSLQFSQTYTFGAPRVFGWAAALKALRLTYGRVFRVVNGNDIVPRIPSTLRFNHVGELDYINSKLRFRTRPSWLYVFFDRVLGYRADILSSHFANHYITSIHAAIIGR
ncbi:MAG: lipase family protein [Woeseiaceae bacterium]|nr:lipase family protein [Woeseiaceae bacterium]